MTSSSSKLVSALLALAALAGCAKDQKYEEVYKESVFVKSALSEDPSDPYVYVPSVGETPKDVTASRSYWMGEQKLVTFKFEENKLVVREIPREERFAANATNFSPVMEFDVNHVDYRCAEDQYGECGNKEEEVDDKNWKQKRFAKIDFESLKLEETNTLPEQLTNLFGNCYGPGATVVKNVKVEPDALNIHVVKTWKASIACADLQSFADLRNLSFSVNYYYSFVKLSKLASKDYETIKYPFEDQNSFGYFTTEMTKLTADNRTRDDSKVVMMNRWNPARKVIVYNLSEGFYQKGMESILENTKQAIATINNSFEKAGVNMAIKLEDGRGKDIGDLRNNFLILVEEPQAAGVIGYGPSVANPRTGEILKAQTVMYYGTIKKFISETYDELLEEKLRAAEMAQSADLANSVEIQPGVAMTQNAAQSNSAHQALAARLTSLRPTTSHAGHNHARRNLSKLKGLKKEMFNPARKIELGHWLNQLKDKKNLSDAELAKATLNEMSHRCFYHNSMMNWSDAIVNDISAENLGIDELKPWDDLSDEEKDRVIAKLMPNVWVPTLVHEVGHNLGLRHNFNGSEDKANYYSADERRSLGIKRDVTYSSVMDYSHSSLNQLPIMGKYDIAALRYGYNRQVELKDGTITALPKGTSLESFKKANEDRVKDFQFCTDEHVEVNPGCNRFDDGAGLKAIAEHFVKTYKKNYTKRNFRNRRANFNSYDGDVNYYFGAEYTFESLRRFFEIYDRISNLYPGLTEIDWDQEIANAQDEAQRENMRSNKEFFEGMKGAAQVAADFYTEILTTPDVHCAVVEKATNQLAGIIPLSNLSDEAESCFSEKARLNPDYMVIGQTGKFLNNKRFSETLPGELNADPSQISVRGIWMDKVLAAEYLTKRVLGISSFDDYRSNFLDYPVFAGKITEALNGFILDSHNLKVDVTLANGKTVEVENTFALGKTHMIESSMHPGLNRFLGINKVEFDLRELLIPTFKKGFAQADDLMANRGALNALKVYELNPSVMVNTSLIKEVSEFKDKEGRLVARFGAAEENETALEFMQLRAIRQVIDGFKRDQVVSVYVARAEAAQQGTEAPVQEGLEVLYELPNEILLAQLQGQLPSDEHLLKMFMIMK